MNTLKKIRQNDQKEKNRMKILLEIAVEVGKVSQGETDLKIISPHAGNGLKNRNGKLMADYRKMKRDHEKRKSKLDKILYK